MELEIRGHNFPGRTHSHDDESRDNVHVGVQIGRDARELAPGDADGAVWVLAIDVIERDGEMDFRGPAVQGRRGERFAYLTWATSATTGRSRCSAGPS